MARQGDVVVLGGSGWVGRVLVPLLRQRGYAVRAPRREALNLGRPDDVLAFLRAAKPAAVVNTAAANPGASKDDFDPVNVVAAEAAASGARAAGARLVHVSSDVVMQPVTPYAASKAEGEARVLASHPDAVSVRTSLLWDVAVMDRGTAGFAARLEAGEPLKLFSDEIRCPLPRCVLAACLVDLIPLAYAGTLDVVGREALSRLDFGRLLLEHFGVAGRERIESVRSADLHKAGAPPRPLDLTLDVAPAEQVLGRRLPGVRDVLAG